MKRIVYTLLVASLLAVGCQKQEKLPLQEQVATMGEEIIDTKATPVASNKQNVDNSLEIDYDLVIKETAKNTFKVKVKLKGLSVKGHEFGNSKLINGVAWGVVINMKGPKLDGTAPLQVTLSSTGKNGDVFEFPEFKYDGDLDYEIVVATTSFRIKGGDIIIKDNSTISIGGSDITVKNGNFKPGVDFTIKEGSSVIVAQQELEPSFAILFSAKDNECNLVDGGSYFLLPNGHTDEQNPEVKRVTLPKTEDGKVMRITITGDPLQTVEALYYTPLPIPDPNKPGGTIQPPVIKLQPSHVNKKKGITRYDSDFIGGESNVVLMSQFNPGGPGWARITMVRSL